MRTLLENFARKMNYFQNKFPREHQEFKVLHELRDYGSLRVVIMKLPLCALDENDLQEC